MKVFLHSGLESMKRCNYKIYSYLSVKCASILIRRIYDILLNVINYKVIRGTKMILYKKFVNLKGW